MLPFEIPRLHINSERPLTLATTFIPAQLVTRPWRMRLISRCSEAAEVLTRRNRRNLMEGIRVKIKQIAFVVMLISVLCSGQSQSQLPSTNVPGAEYPRVNADFSATFRVQADNAQKVQLLMELGQ